MNNHFKPGEPEIRTPVEWEAITHIRIMDPDGWRADGKDYTEPITRAEFIQRAAVSTVGNVNYLREILAG